MRPLEHVKEQGPGKFWSEAPGSEVPARLERGEVPGRFWRGPQRCWRGVSALGRLRRGSGAVPE